MVPFFGPPCMLLNTGQLDTVVLLVVASEMMRGQAPQIFFPRTAPAYSMTLLLHIHTVHSKYVLFCLKVLLHERRTQQS